MTASWAARVLITPIRWYQRFISPALPPTCRFAPSCSAYAVGAITEHGAVRGLWLAIRRLSKCHPWHAGGYDPVPRRVEKGTGPDGAVQPSPQSDVDLGSTPEISNVENVAAPTQPLGRGAA